MAKKVLIDDFEPGMELAIPIKNKFGQILFPANTILEEKHRRIFQTWGIQEFKIVFNPEEGKSNQPVTIYKSVLGDRLNWAPRNSHEENLLEMAVKRITES